MIRLLVVSLACLVLGCEVRMAQIEFPIAGLDRGMAWQKQPPYTSPDMLNVVPVGSITGRARGGSRPGLVRAYPNAQFVASGRLGMMNVVHPTSGTNTASWADNFSTYAITGKIGSPWVLSDLPAGFASNSLPDAREDSQGRRMATVVGGEPIAGADSLCSAGIASATALAGADFAKPYTITATVRPFDWLMNYPYDENIGSAPSPDLRFWGFSLFCRVAAETTDWEANGISVLIDMYYTGSTDGWRHRIRVYDKTTLKTTTYMSISSTGPIEVRVTINGTSAQVWVNGVSIGPSWTATAVGGHCFGFNTWHLQTAMASYVPRIGVGVDEIRTDYYLPSTDVTLEDSPSIVAVSINGLVEWIDTAGSVKQATATGSCNLHYTNRLNAVEWGGKLWIADHETTLAQGSGATLDNGAGAAGQQLSLAGYDFSGRGITAADHVVVLYSASNAFAVGTYKITSVDAGGAFILLADSPSALATDCVFRVERAMKVFNPGSGASGTNSLWLQGYSGGIAKGAIPAGCRLIGRFQNRIILAGRPANTFYMCRAGDPEDWDAGADPDDPGRAFGGVTGEAGRIGNPLTAVATYSDDYFILSTATEIYLGRADLLSGAPLLTVSDKVGIISDRAWCTLPNGGMIFLSNGGLFELPPGGSGRPVDLSSERLPRELKTIDLSRFAPILAWDQDEERVIIFMSGVDLWMGLPPGGATHWFYDYRRKAFFPWRYAEHLYPEPTAILYHQPIGVSGHKVLQMGYDGIIRYFSPDVGEDYAMPYPAAANRPNKAIDSKVLLGPFKTREDLDMMWENLTGVLGHVSASVTWKLFVGSTTEAAYANYQAGTYRETGTWAAGRNRIADVQARGVSFFLLLSCSSVERWEVEEIHAALTPQMMYKPL